MKIRDLIYQWRHFGEDMTGYTSDDTSMSDKAIYDSLISARSIIVTDRNRKEYFSNVMFQTIPCVSFNEVDSSECSIIPPSGCKILKSTCEMPNMLKLVSVSDQLGKSFDLVRWDNLEGKLHSRIESVKNAVYTAIRNVNGKQYLYVFNNNNLKNAVVTAIFEDPIKAAQFCANNGGDPETLCNPMEIDFHTDQKLIDPVLKYTWDGILNVRRAARPDMINDDTNTM